ncbi:hypothetical protein pb186bvf_017181 [Paramecium bursaria]
MNHDPIETDKQYIVDLLLDDFYKLIMNNVELNALKVVIPIEKLEAEQVKSTHIIEVQYARVLQQINLSIRLIHKLNLTYSQDKIIGPFLQEQFVKIQEALKFAEANSIISSDIINLDHSYIKQDELYLKIDILDISIIQDTKDYVFLEILKTTFRNDSQQLRGGRQKTRPLLIDTNKLIELTQFRYQQVIDLAFDAYIQCKILNLLQYFDLKYNKQIYYFFDILNLLQQNYYTDFHIITKESQHIAELYDLIIRLDFLVQKCRTLIQALNIYLESKNSIKFEKLNFTIIEVLIIKSCYVQIKSKYKGDTNIHEQDINEDYILVGNKREKQDG